MKVGDLVRLPTNRLGIIITYYSDYKNKPNGYPWYVWVNGKIEYCQTMHLELL